MVPTCSPGATMERTSKIMFNSDIKRQCNSEKNQIGLDFIKIYDGVV
jgi:hypothetical protein